jgi:glutamate/tyrosine decarboxylase-like PLP-dependent enzyme
MVRHFGEAGYRDLARRTRDTTLLLSEAIAATDPLFVMTKPDSTLICFGSHDPEVSTNALADALLARGWWVDRQGPPSALHMTVCAYHEHVAAEFLTDLRACVDDVRCTSGNIGSSGSYGTIE